MARPRLSKAETRILEQCWKLGTCSVREILESLPPDERVAYTTVQTLVYRLEQKGALRRVKKIGNAQLFEPAIDRSEFRSGVLRELLALFDGSPRLLVSSLLETGSLSLKDLKALQNAARGRAQRRGRPCPWKSSAASTSSPFICSSPRACAWERGSSPPSGTGARRPSTGSGSRPRSTSGCRWPRCSMHSARRTSHGLVPWRPSARRWTGRSGIRGSRRCCAGSGPWARS